MIEVKLPFGNMSNEHVFVRKALRNQEPSDTLPVESLSELDIRNKLALPPNKFRNLYRLHRMFKLRNYRYHTQLRNLMTDDPQDHRGTETDDLETNAIDPLAKLKALANRQANVKVNKSSDSDPIGHGKEKLDDAAGKDVARQLDDDKIIQHTEALKDGQFRFSGIVHSQGQELTADVNSLGQPRKMSPEEAHAKLVGLRVYTRSYWDAQKHRIKIGNRAFSGVTDVETVEDIRKSAKRTEDLLSKALVSNFKTAFPEIYTWTEETPGLGPVLMGRLLGEIGHPCWAFPSHWEGKGETRVLVSDPPFMRNPAKLFAYCGVGDPARRPFKGMTDKDVYAMGNPKAKMLVHLLAESCMKQQGTGNRRRSPYRDTYDIYRARYEDRVEVKIDKDGNKTEKSWSDGHKHNAALRVTGKEILLDLWVLSERTL